LQQQLKRPTDLLCRFGGEQFAALLPDTPQEGALQLAEKMRQRVAGCPLLCGGQRVMITVSVGVTGPQHNGDSKSAKPELLLGRAGQALQRAKTEGRNCVVLAI
jgi:diguanylate cyclase (GGDEF)-like protein